MLISIVLRNVLRNLRRLAPMMFSIVMIFALLIIGNAILERTIGALYDLYAEGVSGDITVSPDAESNFTIFGSDQLLVGQYIIPPTLVQYPRLQEQVNSWPEVHSSTGLVTAMARVTIESQRMDAALFGVNFDRYRQLVSALHLIEGDFPAPGEPGMVVQEHQFRSDEDDDEAPELVGKMALLASGSGRSFTLREVPVTGVIRYPVQDKMLETIVLVDANTARALNGYFHGSDDVQIFSQKEEEALSSDLTTIFGDTTEGDTPEKLPAQENGKGENDAGIDPLNLFSSKGEAEPSKTGSPEVRAEETEEAEGPWNFLLVSLHSREDIDGVLDRFPSSGYGQQEGYLVRPWRSSVGGNALIAWYLQLLFNLGLLFVSFGAVIIAANALLLSILERTGEIGTLRAMGASRARVALIISLETLVIVFGSAIVGICGGIIGLVWINEAQLIIDNRYIQLLFGGEPLRGELSLGIIAGHLFAAAVLSILSMLYPLKRALEISPVKAMAE